MARYGALTALQAALLGISGGAQGLVQAREREQKEAERRKQFEREELRDQREIARDEAERKYREAQLRQQADEMAQRGELTRAEIASRERVAGMQVGSAAAERAEKRRAVSDEAEAWWNQTVIRSPEEFASATPARKAAAARAAQTFNRLRQGREGADARDLITATYAAEQAYQLQRSRQQQKNPMVPIPEEVPSGYLPPERGTSRGGPMAMSFPAPAGGSAPQSRADMWEDLVKNKGYTKSAATAEVERRFGR